MRQKALLLAPDIVVSACHYNEGERHTPHTDRHSRVSVVLRGGYREECRAGAVTMRPGDVLLKSHRAKHSDEFADALLLAIEFCQDDPFALLAPDLWRRRADMAAMRHALTAVDAALAGDRAAAATTATDLVASSMAPEPKRRAAPGWLARLRQSLEDTGLSKTCVPGFAREAGAHPAHVSRLFRRCYGASMTEHALAHSVRRAWAALSDAEIPLSAVAQGAGFYDQSHMNRVFRRLLGRTPGAARAIMTGR